MVFLLDMVANLGWYYRWLVFHLFVMSASLIALRVVIVSEYLKIYVLVICSFYVAYRPILCALDWAISRVGEKDLI